MLEAGNKPEGLKGLRVLVAEDEFAIAMFLVDYLELKGRRWWDRPVTCRRWGVWSMRTPSMSPCWTSTWG